MTNGTPPWTAASLLAALDANAAAGLAVSPTEDANVLEVNVGSAGDFTLHVAVGEQQILTSAVLWARDEQEDSAAFEAMMLRNHKALLPLCALSIDMIDGREFYELFGAMSRDAALDEIVKEFTLIADSAIELARDIGPGASTSEDAA